MASVTYRTRPQSLPPALVAKARPREMSVTGPLTYPGRDLAGDIVSPDGLDFTSHRREPWVDFEHDGRTVAGWCRKSLSRPGKPYDVVRSTVDVPGCGPTTLPFATVSFDPSDRVQSQTFAMFEDGALTGFSLEFRPVPGFCKSLGYRSPLEARDAMRFDRADVVRFTVCATPVCEGAVVLEDGVVRKSARLPVPPALEKVMRDGAIRGERLADPIRKALAAHATGRVTVTGGYEAPEKVLKAREPYHGSYPGDRCPECGEPPDSACRCIRNDRFCPNGHVWERLSGGEPVLLDKAHGRVVKAYGGMTLEQAESKRRTWPHRVEKAMDDESVYDDAGTADTDTAAPAEGEGGEQATPTAQTAYDIAQMLTDACEHAKERIQQSEHVAGKKKLLKLCDQMESLVAKLTGVGDMVAADVGAGGGDMDEDDEEPEVEADATEPDDEDDGVMKAFRAPHRKVYRKAVKRFRLAEVRKGVEAEDPELARLRKKNERLRRDFERAQSAARR